MTKRWGTWLVAVRDGFVSLLPLTFFRVVAELVLKLPFSAYQNGMTELFGQGWSSHLDLIVRSMNNVFSLSLAVLVAVHLAGILPKKSSLIQSLPSLSAGLTALISFILLTYIFHLPIEHFGVHCLLLAVVVGLASAELLHWLNRCTWFERLATLHDTEVNFFYAMRATMPVMTVAIVVYVIGLLCANLLPDQTDFSEPLLNWAKNQGHGMWWLSMAATAINQLFWSIGFHGGLVLDANFGNIFAPAGAAFSTELAWRPLFDNFVLIGGAGATLGLLIAILWVNKQGTQHQLARLSLIPSLFNINDILLYGLPIVLNPRYWLPFIVVPLLLTLFTLAAVEAEFIQFAIHPVSWTTPPLISGWLLTNSWRGVALQILSIAISTALYMPFVRRAEQDRKQKQEQAFNEAKEFISGENHTRVSALTMQGQIGIIARQLLSDLRSDIGLNKLNLAYQPKHDAQGKVLGVEALVRWNNNRYGIVPPNITVNLAEDSGDIHALGLWVLREAFACKARWNALGYQNITMAVNVSPEQLKNNQLAGTIAKLLKEYGLMAGEIELEITESSVIPDLREIDHTLQALADLGLRLAMDDFGMGYSSLLYLRRVQVQAIKVDGSLTRDLLTNPVNKDIIRAIAALGKAQKVDVIAEYVEEEKQLQALKDLGCNIFQGYFYSQPLDEAECVLYFKRNKV